MATTPSISFFSLRSVKTAGFVLAGSLLFALIFAAQASRPVAVQLTLNENAFGPCCSSRRLCRPI
jgi:hypothetical protein